MNLDAILAKYRQACADAGIAPLPGEVVADRLREVWAALEGSGLPDALRAESHNAPH